MLARLNRAVARRADWVRGGLRHPHRLERSKPVKSLIIALPCTQVPHAPGGLEKKALSWALCWFPLVGLAVGGAVAVAGLAGWLGFGVLYRALALLLPSPSAAASI
ncbi:MAG: hypothetical protein ACLRIS_02470 [Flavonifractor plautii]